MGLKQFLFGKINRKLLIWFLLISIIPVALVSFILLQSQTETLTENSLKSIGEEISSDVLIIEEILEDFEQDVLILSENEELGKLINNGNPEELEELKADLKVDFLSFSKQRQDYYQIRYIDENGGEIIRIDNDGENVLIVQEDKLQNKAGRYYFEDTLQLSLGELFISPLDLNIEMGELENRGTEENPIYVPVIRYGTPVFDDYGNKKGIVILNVYADSFLRFVENDRGGFLDAVVNSDGEYVLHPNKEKEFSFMFEDRDYNLEQDHSAHELEEILTNDEGVIRHGEDDHYTIFKRIKIGEDFLILVNVVEKDVLLADTLRLRNIIIILGVFLILGVILLSLFFSSRITNPIEQLYEGAQKFQKRDFSTRVKIKTGDELQVLGDSFNKTADVLENMEKEHKQLEKAKTEFISITSHELRSPMTPMQAQLQMLMGDYYGKLNAKQKQSLDIVARNTKRLDQIIVDFLEISRIEAARLKFRFVKSNLTKHINLLIKEMQGFMPEKKIKIISKIDKLPVIGVDPDRVMQVLRNLINNAIKFSPEGKTVAVTAKVEKGMLQFSVADQGIGIGLEDQKRIFEPFFQAEQTMYREHQGTGLGLAIIKGIVESQNGKVWLESEVGKGTKFYFTVPLKPVLKVRPIKLLFSGQEDAMKKIKTYFVEILGPMGAQEFKSLRDKNQINKKDLIAYVNLLSKKGILDKEKAEVFKLEMLKIFGEEKR